MSKYNDPEVIKRFCYAVSIGSYYKDACKLANISYQTFLNWMKAAQEGDEKYLEFFESVKKAEAQAVTGWLQKIENAANAGQWQAAAWKLERRYPEEWSNKFRIEHSGKVEVDHRTELLSKLSPGASDSETDGSDTEPQQ